MSKVSTLPSLGRPYAEVNLLIFKVFVYYSQKIELVELV